MNTTPVPARRTLELATEHTDLTATLICRGALDARGAPRLGRAIDAALARTSVLVYLDLEDITSIDATGARLVAATIRRCISEPVHLELWPGAAAERALVGLGVALPRRAYPSRPCVLTAGPGLTPRASIGPFEVKERFDVWRYAPERA
jgi:anti-anti-sigma factor